MATNTKNFKFKKPDESDFYDVQDQNGNWDMADEELEKLNAPTFEDYSGGALLPEASSAIDGIKSGFGLPTLLSNIKAAFKGACLLGHIVNNCVTNRSDLPLSAAQGKALMDMLTKLNGEASTHLKESGSGNDFCAAFQSRYQFHTNANYMLANGIYTTDLTDLNVPFNGYWLIITFNTSNDVGDRSHAWIAQFAISTDTNNKAIYFRRNINYTPTTWESWNRLVAS